jgi:FkbM family methyltransferase
VSKITLTIFLDLTQKECNPLWTLWKESRHQVGSLFVDVGANIGSCSLLMAAANISTIAFEPFPENLLYFRNSIKLNSLQNFITLHNTGLGNLAETNVPIYSQIGNAGNSVVKKVIPDHISMSQRMKRNSAYISIERLDDVFWADRAIAPPRIDLMKMDCQGFEINVLRGGVTCWSNQNH